MLKTSLETTSDTTTTTVEPLKLLHIHMLLPKGLQLDKPFIKPIPESKKSLIRHILNNLESYEPRNLKRYPPGSESDHESIIHNPLKLSDSPSFSTDKTISHTPDYIANDEFSHFGDISTDDYKNRLFSKKQPIFVSTNEPIALKSNQPSDFEHKSINSNRIKLKPSDQNHASDYVTNLKSPSFAFLPTRSSYEPYSTLNVPVQADESHLMGKVNLAFDFDHQTHDQPVHLTADILPDDERRNQDYVPNKMNEIISRPSIDLISSKILPYTHSPSFELSSQSSSKLIELHQDNSLLALVILPILLLLLIIQLAMCLFGQESDAIYYYRKKRNPLKRVKARKKNFFQYQRPLNRREDKEDEEEDKEDEEEEEKWNSGSSTPSTFLSRRLSSIEFGDLDKRSNGGGFDENIKENHHKRHESSKSRSSKETKVKNEVYEKTPGKAAFNEGQAQLENHKVDQQSSSDKKEDKSKLEIKDQLKKFPSKDTFIHSQSNKVQIFSNEIKQTTEIPIMWTTQIDGQHVTSQGIGIVEPRDEFNLIRLKPPPQI